MAHNATEISCGPARYKQHDLIFLFTGAARRFQRAGSFISPLDSPRASGRERKSAGTIAGTAAYHAPRNRASYFPALDRYRASRRAVRSTESCSASLSP